ATNVASRYPYAYDSSSSNAPELEIEYDPNTVPVSGGCLAKEYTSRVNTSTDDAEEADNGNMNLTSTDLELVDDGNDQTIGVRFTNLDLAQGVTINNAYIEFTTDETSTTATSLTIRGQDTDSANTFTSSNNNISTRTTTTNSVAWNSLSSWSTEGEVNNTPDLTNIVQEIVDRSGWAAGNDMAFIISGSGKRVAESYNGSSGQAPRLVVWAESTGSDSATTRTVRDELLDMVDEIQYKSGTPIVDTLYEAALYYRGEAVDYGLVRGGSSTSRREHTRVSHADSYTGGTLNQPSGCTSDNLSSTDCRTENISGAATYVSPITSSCQTNHIILLSDGSPSVNDSATKVKIMTGDSSCADSGSAACGPELSSYLYTNDQSSLSGDQTIITYTIGFNFTGTWLRDIATGAGGSFYEASSSTDLTNAFNAIISEMLQQDTTYVSPGVTINSFTRLTHRNELYYSLFKPSENPLWSGNLKRYKLQSDAIIVDANDNAAVDDATGFFKDTAKSFWSGSVDGADVTEGGAAENLPSEISRNVYTYYSSSINTRLSHSANEFSASNTALTKALLGIGAESDAYRTNLMDWVRGVDILDADNDGITSEDRDQLSDPLHSRPHLITYGGTDANPDVTVFYGDNMGFLHAIDADTGVEIFSFIPELLLPNLDTLYTNSSADLHLYGIDGPISSWVNDVDGDSIIEPSDGDHVYIYFGLRRGGNNYYALDVTDRDNPTMLWTIEGGSGDFAELGQTWSRPVNTVVTIGTTDYDVLLFSGGYDADQDDVTVKTVDDEGRALYMVNASTGALLWSAGASGSNTNVTDMVYSIPSSIKAIDINNDGKTDQFYVGDMGGQLWRFDITHGNPANTLVEGGVIADISGSTASSNRRFYHEPDISIHVSDGSRKLAIGIGSGWQAHPLDEGAEDRFYLMFSEDVTSGPESGIYIKYTESDFYDATADTIDVGSSSAVTTAQSDLNASQGWFITLENTGEKVLATSTTSSGAIYFTSYEPSPSSSSCVISAGTPRLYKVNVADATAVSDLNNSGDVTNLTKADRSKLLNTAGLPPAPARLKVQDDDGTTRSVLCVGTECESMDDSGSITKTYWTVEE
ncbi:MAG: hypothetical protein JKY67_21610, partial [Pseudomonadales bacterium]|nr:hypothetical protein [Pseudomonadales bacterium]